MCSSPAVIFGNIAGKHKILARDFAGFIDSKTSVNVVVAERDPATPA